MNDTIYALSTPPGKSGVAVVRLSGAQAKPALEALTGKPCPPARMASLRRLRDPQSGEMIDRALTLYFPGPHSFTGEDCAELHMHGSRAVLRALMRALSRLSGLRLAEAGEFSKRALLNGKMDLTEIEGIADLIDAEAEAQGRQALAQMEGAHGRRFETLRGRVLRALALLEAVLDFPDEDIPDTLHTQVSTQVESLRTEIRALLDDERIGERIREGFTLVILGAPNAGKSSLLNALAKRDAAIVSSVAGTTRDLVEVDMELAGYALSVIDTAGIRDTGDAVEQEGIARALKRAETADITLLLFDAEQLPHLDAATLARADARSILAISKADMGTHLEKVTVDGQIPLWFSAHTGEGMERLIVTLTERLERLTGVVASPLITRERHRRALEEGLAHLERYDPALPLELACEELRRAAAEIGKITGKILTDELLEVIFREFCIGK